MTRNQIISEISRFIRQNGGVFRDWYVGIAADPRHRLYSDHNVSRNSGVSTYCEAVSSPVARSVERYFVNVKRTNGGPGGGGARTKFVYAYKITRYTRQ